MQQIARNNNGISLTGVVASTEPGPWRTRSLFKSFDPSRYNRLTLIVGKMDSTVASTHRDAQFLATAPLTNRRPPRTPRASCNLINSSTFLYINRASCVHIILDRYIAILQENFHFIQSLPSVSPSLGHLVISRNILLTLWYSRIKSHNCAPGTQDSHKVSNI